MMTPWFRRWLATVTLAGRCVLLAATDEPAHLVLSCPSDYEVVQRTTATEGSLHLRGEWAPARHGLAAPDRLEVRITLAAAGVGASAAWQRLPFTAAVHGFDAVLPVAPGGWYRVEVRLRQDGTTLVEATVAHVGVGEVFLVAGQSNAANYGEVRQRPETGLVVAFDGTRWSPANDPQPGATGTQGSFIPSFGDALARALHVPIGMIDIAVGSTSVREWLPEGHVMSTAPTTGAHCRLAADGRIVSTGELFARLVERLRTFSPGGIQAVLWHQGESDWAQPPGHNLPLAEYRADLAEVIAQSRAAAGWPVPWFVAQASYGNPRQPGSAAFRAEQLAVTDGSRTLPGPDTDELGSAWREKGGQGVHFNAAGLKRHGELWAACIEHWLAAGTAAARPSAPPALPAARPAATATDMPAQWSSAAAIDPRLGRPDTRWFEDAKFGLFVHWGLYSAIGNEWQGRDYFGSGEWIMKRAKIPAATYARVAASFNPTGFDAQAWADLARDAGMRYVVVTAKHHEGFAMFRSKASSFNIVDATPYHRDPMAALAAACRTDGLKLGFYYSQFLDWHEPDGGGNTWDFAPKAKDLPRYYATKAIPQIKELLTQYGPLGLMWFDMPGGLSREDTVAFMQTVRRLQPACLISSRVGQGLGDFRDFGDSELPPTFITGPWEALFTETDSWGFVRWDSDFKSPAEIIQLLASVAARGGNLLLNVGPDGTGRIPETSARYLREVGRWLRVNGDSIYGTTHGPVPDQPWGVTTLKPGRLFLHVLHRPADHEVVVPGVGPNVQQVAWLGGGRALTWRRDGDDLVVTLPAQTPDPRDAVIAVDVSGIMGDAWGAAAVIARGFDPTTLPVSRAQVRGQAALQRITSSYAFGDWKHDTCAVGLAAPGDGVEFRVRFLVPGDYQVSLEYACLAGSAGREGRVAVGGNELRFETLATMDRYDPHRPLLFVTQRAGVIHIGTAGETTLVVSPVAAGAELGWLRSVSVTAVNERGGGGS